MRIGLIRPYEIDYNRQDIEDLGRSIRSLRHEPVDIYVDRVGISIGAGRIDVTQVAEGMASRAPEKVAVDCAFLRHLGTIKDYEQFCGRLWSVKAMEQNGVFVMNEISSWLAASDKLASLALMAKAGLPVPETFMSEDMYMAYKAAKRLGDVVVKPLRGAMGFGAFRSGNPDLSMHAFSSITNLSKPIYLQRYLEKSGGGDYRIVVIGGSAIGAEFRKGSDWKSSVAQGAKVSNARMDHEMEDIAVRAAAALGLDYAGIDIARTKDGYFILEANPTMSWQGFRKATGIDVARLLIKHLVSRARG